MLKLRQRHNNNYVDIQTRLQKVYVLYYTIINYSIHDGILLHITYVHV